MSSLYPNATIIQDIGSGINYKRKGLQTLLERLIKGDKFTLVVAHKDRLVRFGFELFEFLFQQNNGTILVLNNSTGDPQTELTNDILTILHVFSCRMHGLRKYYNKIKEDFPEANQESEETT
jgi:predicted site-specific integrase-resolvase